MERVTGIGGFFFGAEDPGALARWYSEHLGVDPAPESYEVSSWWQQAGPTVLAAMPSGAAHLGGAGRAWSISFRVADLDAMVDQLRRAGVEVVVDGTAYPNGRFAELHDPEGNGVQLWQPAGPTCGVRADERHDVDVDVPGSRASRRPGRQWAPGRVDSHGWLLGQEVPPAPRAVSRKAGEDQ